MLSVYTAHLPDGFTSPCEPFINLIVNFNVATTAHRDQMDKTYCLILPIGDFEGGEVCLYEAGMVIRLRPGDYFLFRSQDNTHFNMHFKGKRATLVMSTDKALDGWVGEKKNGWVANSFLTV